MGKSIIEGDGYGSEFRRPRHRRDTVDRAIGGQGLNGRVEVAMVSEPQPMAEIPVPPDLTELGPEAVAEYQAGLEEFQRSGGARLVA